MDAVVALNHIKRASLYLQEFGWSFNMVEGATQYSPSALPQDVLRVMATDPFRNLTKRGNRVYDNTTRAFVSGSVPLDVVLFLPFEDLPEAARAYVTASAAHGFQSKFLGDGDLYQFSAEDVREAWNRFVHLEGGSDAVTRRDVSRLFQSRGWSFNTEWAVAHAPVSGRVTLGANTLRAVPTLPSVAAAQRGAQILNPSAMLTGTVLLDIVRLLPFESLPHAAKTFVTASAARKFRDRFPREDGADKSGNAAAQEAQTAAVDEARAWAEFLSSEGQGDMESVREASIRLQSQGWSFNTEWGVTLPVVSGKVTLAADILRAVPTTPAPVFSQRGQALVNRSTNTTTFTAPVTADMIRFLPLTSLPQHARNFIRASSLSRFTAARGDGQSESGAPSSAAVDEARAWAEFLSSEGQGDMESVREASIRLQSQGWSFNTEWGVTLPPDPSGEVPVPQGTLRVDPEGNSDAFVYRAGKLFDAKGGTFLIGTAVTADLVRLLPFDALPASASSYIRIMSARRCWTLLLGNRVPIAWSETEELQARVNFMNHESEVEDYNILSVTLPTSQYRRKGR